jgi:hypothetical protein
MLSGAGCGDARWTTPFYTNVAPPRELDPNEIDAREVHGQLFAEQRFPSARTCAACHPDHFREWSVSPHAYAQLSPVFNAMQGALVQATNGTLGDFCIRCHTQVGMNLNEPIFTSNLFRHPTSREGVTCIVCHRIDQAYGKVSGRFDVVQGDLTQPVYGPSGDMELKRVLEDPEGVFGELRTAKEGTGQAIHRDVRVFAPLTESSFCGTCHDVTLADGFRLEEAFSEYKSSPAAAEGVSCQDCHMGTEPGVDAGYANGPAALVFGSPTTARKRTNHMFPGPDHSIVHPGLFPHLMDKRDLDLANMSDWLQFRHEDGWGADEFEDALKQMPEDQRPVFPDVWRKRSQRRKAAKVLAGQTALLEEYREAQLEILRAGYRLGEVVVHPSDGGALAFDVEVFNGTNGHNVPTGFIAERSVFLEVRVRDAEGALVFESGDTDPNGDVRDSHSLYVHNGELPLDEQLFSLQSKFLIQALRGGEQEVVLPVNHSLDPVPFVRPTPRSTILTGQPPGARIKRNGIEPGGRRWARYEVAPELLTGQGPYVVDLRLISGMVPPNLVAAIQHVGFDYGLSPREVARRVVAGRRVIWERRVPLEAGRHAAAVPAPSEPGS